MSNSRKSEGDSGKRRNLPSWMSSEGSGSKFSGKKPTSSGKNEQSNEYRDDGPSYKETIHSKKSAGPSSCSTKFSMLMDGVVFALSGFVNPERATLRSQALEMGAEYRPDWTLDCTLLVCAFPNTPKFRQVEADCGSIVKKEWISDCYSQKKLVEIDSYLMHAGKPWQKSNISNGSSGDPKASPPRKSEKQVDGGSHSKPTPSSSSKSRAFNTAKEVFSPPKVKKWAIDDLNRTISWLESQEEKPEPSETKQIAAGGIIICLQDAIDSLEQNQDVRKIADQWNVVPRAVEELVKLLDSEKDSACVSKEDLCRQTRACIKMYEAEFYSLADDSEVKKKRLKTAGSERGNKTSLDAAAGYDSDQTIEMTQEEIDVAYNTAAATICK